MRKIFSFFLAFFILFPAGVPDSLAQTSDLRNSVVKIFVHANPPDYFRPWQSKGSDFGSGSGCVIEGNRILTSAHVVSHHTFIQVKKGSEAQKYTARVEAIGHDSDLAILTVDDPAFFEGTNPIPLGDLPALKDKVTVLGYPRGGDQLSVTEGVVSRIDVTPYSHSSRALLAVQIDAAINPGNSGGPVVKDGKLVGIAFQDLVDGKNIGYIIPTPIIHHFFEDLENGRYDGFPVLGILISKTENPALRDFYGLENHKGGVLITEVVPQSPAYGHLKRDDIILEVEGVPIASDATIEIRPGEQVVFTHLFNQRQVGEDLNLKILREEQELSLSILLEPYTELVPSPFHYDQPPYYIYGGLVFTSLTSDLLRNWDPRWGLTSLMMMNYYNTGPGRLRPKDREEVALLLSVLPDHINVGYHDIRLQVIDRINGKPVRSFKDLVQILHTSDRPRTVIDTETFSRIVIDHSQVEKANERILERYRIPAISSKDVADWLKQEGEKILTLY